MLIATIHGEGSGAFRWRSGGDVSAWGRSPRQRRFCKPQGQCWRCRRAGQMLAEMPKAAGARVNGRDSFGAPIVVGPNNEAPTLASLGITYNDSSLWQKLAAIDEVKDLRDKAEAMAAYARQARDTEMIQWATEIKVRSERRAGQLLAEMPKAGGARVNGRDSLGGPIVVPPKNDAPTLSDLGITKNDSSRWQKLAAIDEEKFEAAVAAAKDAAGQVTTAASRKPRCTMPRATPSTKCTKPCTARRFSGSSHCWRGKCRRCTAQCRQQAVTAALQGFLRTVVRWYCRAADRSLWRDCASRRGVAGAAAHGPVGSSSTPSITEKS